METLFIVLRVVISLGAVFGALFWGHRWITKRGTGGARGKQIAIVARQALGAKASIAIVDAHGRRYLLGVTEHTVTVLDTLGPAEAHDGVQLVSTAPVSVPSFERELHTITLSTGAVPVLVHGRADPEHPNGPITRTIAITRSQPILPPERPLVSAYPTRRAARAAEAAREAVPAQPERPGIAAAPQQGGMLAGSVLSPQTWKQTFAALKQFR